MNEHILIKCCPTVTLQTNATAKLVPLISIKCIIAKFKHKAHPASQTVPMATGMYIFSEGSNPSKSCTSLVLKQNWFAHSFIKVYLFLTLDDPENCLGKIS